MSSWFSNSATAVFIGQHLFFFLFLSLLLFYFLKVWTLKLLSVIVSTVFFSLLLLISKMNPNKLETRQARLWHVLCRLLLYSFLLVKSVWNAQELSSASYTTSTAFFYVWQSKEDWSSNSCSLLISLFLFSINYFL